MKSEAVAGQRRAGQTDVDSADRQRLNYYRRVGVICDTRYEGR